MVSIIIPFNIDRGFLKQAIKSAVNQGEIILSESDGSVGHNVNQGIKRVKTEFVCILAEDDLLTETAIQDRLKAIKNYQWIHSRAVNFGEDYETPLNWTFPHPILKDMLIMNRICGSTTLYRTELFDDFKWDVSLFTAEEYDFHLKLMHSGIMPGFCDKITFKYRRHDAQKSLGRWVNQSERSEVINKIKDRYR